VFKAAVQKVTHGFLIGFGFAVALALLLFAYDAWQTRKFEKQFGEMGEFGDSLPSFKNFSPEAGLVIKEHRPQSPEANSAFIGVMQNTGSDSWQTIEVLVELFDKQGAFVDKCSSYLDGSIGPGQARNFKVSCSECRNNSQPLVYDRYKIEIVSASYMHPEKSKP